MARIRIDDLPQDPRLNSREMAGILGGAESSAALGPANTSASTSTDAQLANIDLQNMLQKQQQLVQMMSNVSKALSDIAAVVKRNIG